jgi:hypothetical protein
MADSFEHGTEPPVSENNGAGCAGDNVLAFEEKVCFIELISSCLYLVYK